MNTVGAGSMLLHSAECLREAGGGSIGALIRRGRAAKAGQRRLRRLQGGARRAGTGPGRRAARSGREGAGGAPRVREEQDDRGP